MLSEPAYGANFLENRTFCEDTLDKKLNWERMDSILDGVSPLRFNSGKPTGTDSELVKSSTDHLEQTGLAGIRTDSAESINVNAHLNGFNHDTPPFAFEISKNLAVEREELTTPVVSIDDIHHTIHDNMYFDSNTEFGQTAYPRETFSFDASLSSPPGIRLFCDVPVPFGHAGYSTQPEVAVSTTTTNASFHAMHESCGTDSCQSMLWLDDPVPYPQRNDSTDIPPKSEDLVAMIPSTLTSLYTNPSINVSMTHSDPPCTPAERKPVDSRKEKSTGKSKQALNAESDKKCKVCGDRAVNHNFGQLTCESCKAFFRRNAHKLLPRLAGSMYELFGDPTLLDSPTRAKCFPELSCSSKSGEHEITPATRRECPACRLKKCFAVGMRPDLIQVRKKDGSKPRWLDKVPTAAFVHEKHLQVTELSSFQSWPGTNTTLKSRSPQTEKNNNKEIRDETTCSTDSGSCISPETTTTTTVPSLSSDAFSVLFGGGSRQLGNQIGVDYSEMGTNSAFNVINSCFTSAYTPHPVFPNGMFNLEAGNLEIKSNQSLLSFSEPDAIPSMSMDVLSGAAISNGFGGVNNVCSTQNLLPSAELDRGSSSHENAISRVATSFLIQNSFPLMYHSARDTLDNNSQQQLTPMDEDGIQRCCAVMTPKPIMRTAQLVQATSLCIPIIHSPNGATSQPAVVLSNASERPIFLRHTNGVPDGSGGLLNAIHGWTPANSVVTHVNKSPSQILDPVSETFSAQLRPISTATLVEESSQRLPANDRLPLDITPPDLPSVELAWNTMLQSATHPLDLDHVNIDTCTEDPLVWKVRVSNVWDYMLVKRVAVFALSVLARHVIQPANQQGEPASECPPFDWADLLWIAKHRFSDCVPILLISYLDSSNQNAHQPSYVICTANANNTSRELPRGDSTSPRPKQTSVCIECGPELSLSLNLTNLGNALSATPQSEHPTTVVNAYPILHYLDAYVTQFGSFLDYHPLLLGTFMALKLTDPMGSGDPDDLLKRKLQVYHAHFLRLFSDAAEIVTRTSSANSSKNAGLISAVADSRRAMLQDFLAWSRQFDTAWNQLKRNTWKSLPMTNRPSALGLSAAFADTDASGTHPAMERLLTTVVQQLRLS